MNKPKALLVLPSQSTFTAVDKAILSRFYELEVIDLQQNGGRWLYLRKTILMMTRILVSNARLVIVWFADYHAAAAVVTAKSLNKTSLLFIGGYDAVCYPELGMGVYCYKLRALCASFALRNCSLIVANHESLLRSTNTYYRSEGHPDGIYNLVPGLTTPVKVIYNALSISAPSPDNLTGPRVERFLCVGTTPRYEDTINKGYDLIARAAKLLPDMKFEIVGIAECWHSRFIREHRLESCPNLVIHSYLPHDQIIELMRRSRWFIQASISEGMPNALMEAMAMGCLPIGSKVAAIPTLISDKGVIMKHRDIESLISAINAVTMLSISPIDISASIVDVFTKERREKELKTAIMELGRSTDNA